MHLPKNNSCSCVGSERFFLPPNNSISLITLKVYSSPIPFHQLKFLQNGNTTHKMHFSTCQKVITAPTSGLKCYFCFSDLIFILAKPWLKKQFNLLQVLSDRQLPWIFGLYFTGFIIFFFSFSFKLPLCFTLWIYIIYIFHKMNIYFIKCTL